MEKSVLVIGGGIAGIQAALDLADKGVTVQMVERTPSIGGRMAQLDKTFPTNDCSICILAPKMADCYSHPNINVMTYSDVKEVSGNAGDFTVKVLRKARYVIEGKCTGCGDCFDVCPVILPSEFNALMGERHAIYLPFLQAVPRVATIDSAGVAPCSNACPGGLSAQGYVALIKEGKFKEAVDLIRETIPLPSVCGRICHHPCETECNRKEVDTPVAIAALKSFIGDYMRGSEEDTPPEIVEKREEKVAIVGAGPAGLTAAYRLALKGFKVKIFEASDKPGGMLWWGIPNYRLPRDVLQAEVDYITKTGVEIEYGKTIGKDITLDQLKKDYNAVFIAVGAQEGRKLPIPGADLKGTFIGLDILRDDKLGKKIELGRKVMVLGGGNVAFDCARTALRLGAKEVHMACLESREEMPADETEIKEGEEEGIVIHPSRAFTKIIDENGKITGVECQNVKWMKFDEDGKLELETEPNSEHVLPADTIIFSIGQKVNLDLLKGMDGIETTKRNTIAASDETMATGVPGVFAGGDAATGPKNAIDAIAAGNRAAMYIEKYINGEKVEPVAPAPEKKIVSYEDVKNRKKEEIEKKERVPRTAISPEKRKSTFDEVESIYTKEQALEEASRCLNCGPCSVCGQCKIVCKAEAVDYHMPDTELIFNVAAIIVATGFDMWDPSVATEYGYGKYPNVFTALEYERMINASGPTGGHINRRSDGNHPKKMAFIQCVGSRNPQMGHEYCCSVCCMFSIKEAMLSREHYDDIESTIFYKDLRTCSKNFFEYSERAKNDYNVRTINSDATVKENPDTNNPIVVYDVGGRPVEEEFELVVLANTLIPRRDSNALAELLGINVDEFGFLSVPNKVLSPSATQVPGIFVAGFCAGPADIPESVAQGSGAAAKAMEVIASSEGGS